MKVRVDHDRCFGFGRCVEIAPNTFVASVQSCGNSTPFSSAVI